MTKTTESKWRALIRAQEKSGLAVREFAASRGIAASTLYWWRSKLNRSATELVPVEVVAHDFEIEHAATISGFDLHLPCGSHLRVPHGFDAGELRRLVSALRC
ncbi:MAG: hypothetical protein HRT86_10295 [Ilumatobacteraceae bacterium]|nr:hypothetical protein [Ilumatobacteraceae bacterium]